MSEIDNFKRFEVAKFLKQESFLKVNQEQSKRKVTCNSITRFFSEQENNYCFSFLKVSEILETNKLKIKILCEDLTGHIILTYKKAQASESPFIPCSYYLFKIRLKKINEDTFYNIEDFRPVGYSNILKKSQEDITYGALISDVHIGSIYFMNKEFTNFLDFLNNEKDIKYLFIAGDLIDGVGVYPEQEMNLYEKNAYLQYKEVSRLFTQHLHRNDITVYFSPGNHDFLSIFEPQIIPERIKDLLPKNWVFLKNPDYFKINDKKFLIYHGRSVDSLISDKTPLLSYEKIDLVYDYMFNQRNLSPTTLGSRIDMMKTTGMIEEIPDYFLSGHVHKWCFSLKNGVLFCNSGCWQHETEYQKNLDIHPCKGIVQLINLSDPSGISYKVDFKKEKIYKEVIKPNIDF